MLQKILHVLGHTCDTSVNGLEAVVAVTGQKPAVDGAPVPRSDGEESVMTRDYDLILMVRTGLKLMNRRRNKATNLRKAASSVACDSVRERLGS